VRNSTANGLTAQGIFWSKTGAGVNNRQTLYPWKRLGGELACPREIYGLRTI